MSKIKNIILDYGHGGIDSNGKYTTAPSKMFKFDNGDIAYEGVLNRQIGGLVERLLKCLKPDLNVLTTVQESDPKDVSLYERVQFANKFNKKETILVSIHSNASTSHKARGFEIFTTKGFTKSDILAEKIANRVQELYNKIDLKLRFDTSDGDKDKEVDFYVLRKTTMPAVLLECLFFDNKEDFKKLK